jgi:hypothetical protein
LAIQLAAHFRFVKGWYRRGPVVVLVLAYYAVLRSGLRVQPELRRRRTRCRHCGIFFLTHPRKVGRRDLGCPFGCRAAHRRRQCNQRTAACYREEAGRDKQRALNAKRRKRPSLRAPPPPPPPPADQLPSAWTLETFPFDRQPKLNRKAIFALYDTMDFLTKAQNIVWLGRTGCGKTGLASSFLVGAIQRGATGRYVLFADLVGYRAWPPNPRRCSAALTPMTPAKPWPRR